MITNKQTEIVTSKNITHTGFSLTAGSSIAPATASKKTYVVAIAMHNNSVTGTNDTVVRLQDGSGGAHLYGSGTGGIYLTGRGGFFGLPMSVAVPWMETTANTALWLVPVSGYQVAGAVWYYQEP